jgi:hypothetical protein
MRPRITCANLISPFGKYNPLIKKLRLKLKIDSRTVHAEIVGKMTYANVHIFEWFWPFVQNDINMMSLVLCEYIIYCCRLVLYGGARLSGLCGAFKVLVMPQR